MVHLCIAMKNRPTLLVLSAMAALVLYLPACAARPVPPDRLRILFWNLENFFDWRDDSLNVHPSEAEFSSFGARHWTRSRFQAKCDAIAKSLLWVADEASGLPDIVTVAEVENLFVLKRLLSTTLLRKYDYVPVHFDAPDPRGIDVALLYRSRRFRLLRAAPLPVRPPPGRTMQTRDILLACLRDTLSGDSLAVLVNHHPSKFGGDSTAWRREAAVRTLCEAVDSLQQAGWSRIVAVGDFNDTPDQPLYAGIPLENLALPLARSGEGTLRYEGRWELIDQAYVSASIVRSGCRLRILRIPGLMTRDSAHSGEKPLRTYSGPRYLGGVSDHCPILLELSAVP